MSDAKGTPGDPSMEDILASIRRIIADDETRATVSERPAVVLPAAPRGPEDVLLLTDLVEEPAKNVPSSQPDQTRQDTEGLVESAVARAASSAFAGLTQVAGEPVATTPAARSDDSASSGTTLEDLVREMIRPMLKDWLDRNLPAIVEREVEREIARRR